MLSTTIDKPFDNKVWVFEVKWDELKAILFLHKTKGILKIVSRNGKTITHRYPEIIEAVKSFGKEYDITKNKKINNANSC